MFNFEDNIGLLVLKMIVSHFEVSWYSLEQEHLVEVLDELSSTTVDFFRSERELEYMCLYAV